MTDTRCSAVTASESKGRVGFIVVSAMSARRGWSGDIWSVVSVDAVTLVTTSFCGVGGVGSLLLLKVDAPSRSLSAPSQSSGAARQAKLAQSGFLSRCACSRWEPLRDDGAGGTRRRPAECRRSAHGLPKLATPVDQAKDRRGRLSCASQISSLLEQPPGHALAGKVRPRAGDAADDPRPARCTQA